MFGGLKTLAYICTVKTIQAVRRDAAIEAAIFMPIRLQERKLPIDKNLTAPGGCPARGVRKHPRFSACMDLTARSAVFV